MKKFFMLFFLLSIFISTGCTRQADELEKRKAEEIKIVDNPPAQPQPPKQTESNIEFVKITPFEVDLEKIREWEGKHYSKITEQDYFKELISKVFGDNDSLFIENIELSVPFKKIEENNNYILITTGLARHQGGISEGLLSINLNNGSVTGGILSEKKIMIYSVEASIESVPLVVKEQISTWENDIKQDYP